MDPPVYDTLILSDVHLGSDCSRAHDATRVLRENSFQRLILLGDIFADLNFGRLTKEHWRFLGYIRKLSNPKRKVEVVWVEGNHDHGLTDVMSHLVGVKVYQEFAWEHAGLRQLAIHGHQFDGFAVNSVRLNRLGTLLYLWVQKLDLKGKPVAKLIDRLNTRWLRMSSKVASGALSYARQHGVDRIFCGHTHEATYRERDGVQYYNAGGWTDSKPTYLTIGEEGVRIHVYQEDVYQEHEYQHEHRDRERDERLDHCDSGKERGEADSALAELAGESGLPEDAEYESIGS
jgi:UDP-2,3-diacylglucosamine pyrophosphatase LpxH